MNARTVPVDLAKQFHDIYERLAPQFNYHTRPETREFDPKSPNGKLMTAVCAEIIAAAPQIEPTNELILAVDRALDEWPASSNTDNPDFEDAMAELEKAFMEYGVPPLAAPEQDSTVTGKSSAQYGNDPAPVAAPHSALMLSAEQIEDMRASVICDVWSPNLLCDQALRALSLEQRAKEQDAENEVLCEQNVQMNITCVRLEKAEAEFAKHDIARAMQTNSDLLAELKAADERTRTAWEIIAEQKERLERELTACQAELNSLKARAK